MDTLQSISVRLVDTLVITVALKATLIYNARNNNSAKNIGNNNDSVNRIKNLNEQK